MSPIRGILALALLTALVGCSLPACRPAGLDTELVPPVGEGRFRRSRTVTGGRDQG
ncbi:MAG TPA: hypothetical protein VFG35_23225 [Actinoplanes sp.]|nr:hypothetical protein [Actinoplanes sp.]